LFTSISLINGDSIGKILSTPTFPDILRTVKVLVLPVPLTWITTPRNTWIRSLRFAPNLTLYQYFLFQYPSKYRLFFLPASPDRKKDPTRRQSGDSLLTRGKNPLDIDPRPSVRATIMALKNAAQKAEQAQEKVQDITAKEER